ncbi:GNAT family N-acetyltransferase [Pseudomonas sp. R4-35-07]|uniref:GNAT family N-acetyltransferase n=1 Tax=Pseudomonas sp. R4-35-07 TaxID=658643 RepID=UPI002115BCD8|nr:GNAT family N-acetyltransferase [Pseudomonas sp. R4-35-07]
MSRLAIDKGAQSKGLGQRLMSDFFRRVYTVSKQSGVAFVIVDAKDQDAADYYQRKLGFVPSTNSPLRLVLSTATFIQMLDARN